MSTTGSIPRKPSDARRARLDAWERSWRKHWRQWGQSMMQAGVFAKEEIGFGYVTDSPREAVELIMRSLPAEVQKRLKPVNR